MRTTKLTIVVRNEIEFKWKIFISLSRFRKLIIKYFHLSKSVLRISFVWSTKTIRDISSMNEKRMHFKWDLSISLTSYRKLRIALFILSDSLVRLFSIWTIKETKVVSCPKFINFLSVASISRFTCLGKVWNVLKLLVSLDCRL